MVSAALDAAIESGKLPPAGDIVPTVERPKQSAHGDFSSSVALEVGSRMQMPPREVASIIVAMLEEDEMMGRVDIAGPGFINFSLSERWLQNQVLLIRSEGELFGRVDIGSGASAQVEFVSVNPTGPLHVGHARGAVIGNALANILAAAGYDVQREYYVNDAGNQVRIFTASLYARYLQAMGIDAELPEESYPGDYVASLGKQLYDEFGDSLVNASREDAIAKLAPIALELTVQNIRESLARLGIEYDIWFSEQSLIDGGDFDEALKVLESNGFISEREGALWFLGTRLGLDSDSVIIRSENRGHSYFGTDIAYHYNKLFKRGFEHVVNVWGADHHGHVARMNGVLEALGADPSRLTIVINQLISLKSEAETVRFSKRADNFISVDDLIDEVGADACNYMFLDRAAGTHMEFDMDLAKRESSDNPVYYVQYAHARLCSLLRTADERGIDFKDGDVSLLSHHRELVLMRRLNELPNVVARSAELLEPHHMPHFAYEVARELQRFYEECRVLSSAEADLPIAKARLLLVDASRIVLANALRMMGMSAPERM